MKLILLIPNYNFFFEIEFLAKSLPLKDFIQFLLHETVNILPLCFCPKISLLKLNVLRSLMPDV